MLRFPDSRGVPLAATPEIFGAVIIALGSFNPRIFTPDWLALNNLVGPEDAESARTSANLVVSQPFTHVETSWFDLQVGEDRLILSSKDAVTPALKDLATGMFSILVHTPVTALGLNFTAHYRMDSDADYHKVGDVLAPKAIWEKLYPGKDRSAGLHNLQMVIFPFGRGDAPTTPDKKQISVQPSTRIKHGVYFAFNDHHEVKVVSEKKLTQAEIAVTIIDTSWQSAMEESNRVFDGLLEHSLGRKEHG